MRTPTQEMSLSSALADPLIRAVMAADRVDPVKLQRMLSRIARQTAPSVAPAIEEACGCAA